MNMSAGQNKGIGKKWVDAIDFWVVITAGESYGFPRASEAVPWTTDSEKSTVTTANDKANRTSKIEDPSPIVEDNVNHLVSR